MPAGCLVLQAVGFALPTTSPPSRCALTAPFHHCLSPSTPTRAPTRPSAVCFLWHFPWDCSRWSLATTVPWGPRAQNPALGKPVSCSDFPLCQPIATQSDRPTNLGIDDRLRTIKDVKELKLLLYALYRTAVVRSNAASAHFEAGTALRFISGAHGQVRRFMNPGASKPSRRVHDRSCTGTPGRPRSRRALGALRVPAGKEETGLAESVDRPSRTRGEPRC